VSAKKGNTEKGDSGGEKASVIEVERLESPDNAAVLKLGGYLQQKESKELVKHIDALSVEGVSSVILDMSNVKYINSSAMGAFTNCATLLKAKGGKLVLLSMVSNIRLVFATLGLLGLFEIAKTREDAIKLVS